MKDNYNRDKEGLLQYNNNSKDCEKIATYIKRFRLVCV